MSYKNTFYFIFLVFFSFINSKIDLNEEEKSDDIIILHTNDVHCGIEDNIGYDGLSLYKKELQTKYKHVLLVDAGDNIQGGAIGLINKGKDIIDIMNHLEYDAVGIGNHEFDYKIEQLFNLSSWIKTGYICANFLYRKTKKTVFPPYNITKVGNKTIGFIGILTPQTLTETYLHTLVDDDGELLYDFLSGNEGQDLYNEIQGYIDHLREEENVTHVILVSHMGYGGDALEQYTTPALLAHITGVDAIIDGHTHLKYNSTFPDREGNQIHICQTGTKLKNIGKITITTDGNITSEMISEVPIFEGYDEEQYLSVERGGKDVYVDNETHHFIQDIINSHEDEFKEVIGYSDFDLLISTKDKPLINRIEENTLCNLVADMFRYYGQTDISLVNAGAVRDNILKGNITFNTILNILPYSAKLYVKEVLGQDILDALEFGVRILPERTSKFLQVSGIKFKVDESFPSSVVIDQNENFVSVDGERRVYDVYIGKEKINEKKKYSVTLVDFLSDGGDGYSMFRKYKTANDTQHLDNEAFRLYIETVLNRNIPDEYRTTSGRIVKEKKPTSSSSFIKYYRKLALIFLCLIV